MRTKLLILAAIIFIANDSFGQFHIGVKGGANVTKIDGVSFKDQFNYGYQLGGFMEVGLGKKIGIQPEVLFNQSNTRVDSNYKSIYQNVFNSSSDNVRLNYLAIPVLLTYKVFSGLSLQAGPQYSILMDQSKTLLQNGGNAFSEGDFSMVGGAQIKLSKFRVSGRYVVGLNNINQIDNKDQWKSQAIQVSLGLAL
jgi:hypothetical protein